MLGLYSVYKSGCDLTCEIWILGIIFEVSSAERRTFDVYGRSENYGYIVGLSFFSDGFAHFFHQLAVKGAGA